MSCQPPTEGKLTGVHRALAWIGNNAVQVDAGEYQASLKEKCPELLQPGEFVELAFKVERDKFYFTDRRLLFKNKKAITGLKVHYRSVPYSSMTAFCVQTAGQLLDADSECAIWTEMYDLPCVVLNFVAGRVDVFEVKQFLNYKLLDGGAVPHDVAGKARPAMPDAAHRQSGAVDQVLNLLGGDAAQIDAAAVEQQLRTSPPVLLGDERVEMAFKCGRDSTLLTTKRLLLVDVQGITGTKVQYRSVLWKTVRAFSLQTAGQFLDRDSEMRVWTNMPAMKVLGQDFRKGKADIMAIQRFMTNRVLGLAAAERCQHAAPQAMPGSAGDAQQFFQWLGDDARQIDARQVDHLLHVEAPVLQEAEHAEMAFKGRRDLTVFTTKRLLVVDIKGWTGTKREYRSVPWTSVQAFAVRSAGAVFDKDSEMMVWTDIMFEEKVGDDPPKPGMSYLEQDFRKDQVDLMAVHRYLSSRVLPACSGAPIAVITGEVLASSPPGGLEAFLNFIGDDARQLDAGAVDDQLHRVNPMLQREERVHLAFKSGRDMAVFTSSRVLLIDVQGFTGSKVEYKSLPYACVRGFSVESAGAWDRDASMTLFLRTPWMPYVTQDLRKGRADIVAIQRLLADKVLGSAGNGGYQPSAFRGDAPGTGLEAFLAWVGSDARQIDHAEVDRQLHSSPPILQEDERVDYALKILRDMFLFTNKRLLIVDVKGFTGKKVNYITVPYASCQAFSVQSAGKFDRDAESYVWTDIPGLGAVYQDLWNGKADIFEIQSLLADKILGR